MQSSLDRKIILTGEEQAWWLSREGLRTFRTKHSLKKIKTFGKPDAFETIEFGFHSTTPDFENTDVEFLDKAMRRS